MSYLHVWRKYVLHNTGSKRWAASNGCSNTAAFYKWLIHMCDMTQGASAAQPRMDAAIRHTPKMCASTLESMQQYCGIPLMTPLYVWHNTASKHWTFSNGCSSNMASFRICLLYMCGVNMCCITQGASAGQPRMDAAIRHSPKCAPLQRCHQRVRSCGAPWRGHRRVSAQSEGGHSVLLYRDKKNQFFFLNLRVSAQSQGGHSVILYRDKKNPNDFFLIISVFQHSHKAGIR